MTPLANANAAIFFGIERRFFGGLFFLFCLAARTEAQTNGPAPAAPTNNALVMIQGSVEVAQIGHAGWSRGVLNEILYPGDRVRTGERSRAEVYLAGGSAIKEDELSEVEIPAPQTATFKAGVFDIFHRDRNNKTEYNLPGANAAIRGTDFIVKVNTNGSSELVMLDGVVTLRNNKGEITITNNQRGVVEIDGRIHEAPMLKPINDLIQWSLYYPGVVDVDELEFPDDERNTLKDSLDAYRAGDLLTSATLFPWQHTPSSNAGHIYQAALLLSVGRAEEARNLLADTTDSPATRALQQMLAVTKHVPWSRTNQPQSASEWLAESYTRQASNHIESALQAAQSATAHAPRFGFALERVAELEFSSGHTDKALSALDSALAISPRNAQALALKGFLLAAQNRITPALSWFDRAISADSALGNAWLGRGLCKIREGKSEEGRRDLLVAASLEPQRSFLRSYLGKAFANAGEDHRARREFDLAKALDPNDPTPWLYSALQERNENRINKAVDDLEKSIALNDNRAVYRSQFLLDQDHAVRSASLAGIYGDAGMDQTSLDEASRAVNYDYANYSAHLFLSDAYNNLRDPTRFNLRYETAWFNELLLANLYAPPGAGIISEYVSQQEYSRLFDKEGFGLDSDSQYRSDGQFREVVSQYGSQGGTSYSLDLDYQHNDGIRRNNDLSDIEWYSQIKQQLSPHDAVMLFTKYEDYHSGDNFQYNNPTNVSRFFRYDDRQAPIIVGAWHHEWGPGVHTLLLAGRLVDDSHFSDRSTDDQSLNSYFLVPTPTNSDKFVYGSAGLTNFTYSSEFTIYTAELNQIFQGDKDTLILGGRFQSGQFTTHNEVNYGGFPFLNPLDTTLTENFSRISAYAYYSRELLSRLFLTAGITYDHLEYPDNFRFYPITSGQTTREQISPKAALIWEPRPEVTLRAAYAQALGGVSFDQSFTLEPSQKGGFNQSFRSIISESVVGSLAAPRYQVFGAAADIHLKSHTYLTLEGQLLTCDSDEDIGVLYVPISSGGPLPAVAGAARERLRYREPSASITLNQLLADNWAIGAQYKYNYSKLSWFYPTIVGGDNGSLNQTETAELHQWSAYLQFFHPSGFYARADAEWYLQNNTGHSPSDFDAPRTESDFVQVNLFAGYRWMHRRGDLSFGVLNVGGGNYSLNALNVHNELPRSRVFMGKISFNF